MLDALLSAVVVAVLVALALAALYAVTVVPFLVVVGLAERRRLSTSRWAGAALVAVLLGLALALLAWRADAPRPLQVLPLLLGFAPALALGLDRAPAGRHESPL